MERTLLLERAFIFEADHDKGFRKLRDNQFPRAEQGIVHEPIANALDQQEGDDPIEITLKNHGAHHKLTYRDNGEGLTFQNLEALHFIGKTTKRPFRSEKIGRFGMGLAGAFNRRLGVFRVEIESCVCGKPSRIVYDCGGEGTPLWWSEPLRDAECGGLSISFFFPSSRLPEIETALSVFLDKTIVPVRFNGEL